MSGHLLFSTVARFWKCSILNTLGLARYKCAPRWGARSMSTKVPDPVDKHVGSQVRLRRRMLRMSQQDLGDQLGLTFQQVQKYEKGTNRISASRLQALSNVLQVTVPFFFEGCPQNAGSGAKAPTPAYVFDFLACSDGLKLMQAFMHIGNAKLRASLVRFVEEIGGEIDN